MTASSVDVAIVTGGAGGIGSAIIQSVIDRGGSVVGVDLDACPFPVTDRLVWVRGDISSEETIDAAFRAAGAAGGPRALFSSAFADHRVALKELTTAQVMTVFEQQVVAAWRWGTRLAAGQIDPDVGSAIVHVSSVHARLATPGAASYAMAKAALEALTRAMAVELGPRGVRCNAVEPGFVPVARNAHRWRAAAPDAIACHLPLRRVVTAAEVAEAAIFLAGPQASAITGVCLPVDAGMSAALPEWA